MRHCFGLSAKLLRHCLGFHATVRDTVSESPEALHLAIRSMILGNNTEKHSGPAVSPFYLINFDGAE